MPLPGVASGTALRCSATCKATRERCKNPAAFGMPVCRYHGARKRDTVKHGASHPQYKHGRQTMRAKARHSEIIADLRKVKALAYALGFIKRP